VRDPLGQVTVSTQLDHQGLARISVDGHGSVEGMAVAARSFEAAFARLPADQGLHVIVDLSGLEDASLAGQLSLVPWLLRHQHRLRYLGVVGARTTALKIAQAVVQMLPFNERIGFFNDEDELKGLLKELVASPPQ
tara:strand:+ start:110 stop:517 length:408 start_codon:yes stop_codon:yes gene_type:complete